MRTQIPSKKERNGDNQDLKNSVLESLIVSKFVQGKKYDELTEKEIMQLTPDDLEYLREKNQSEDFKPTIIGKEPYEPFLPGEEDNWMSVGDKIKED